jgi:hypothetical protein
MLVLVGIAGISIFIIIFITKKFTNVTLPKKTAAMLDDIEGVKELGLERNESGYRGTYRNYFVSIFATTRPGAYNERYQVVVSVAPEKDQLKNIGGFFSTYFVSGEQAGFAYAGFMLNPNIYNETEGNLQRRLDTLINILEKENVKPYTF